MNDYDSGPLPQVRTRVDRDLPACVTALRAVHLADGYPTNWPQDPQKWLTGSADAAAWVAEWEGRIVGHVALVRPGPEDIAPSLVGTGSTSVAVVSRLFVDPAARGRRVGALLLERAIERARALGARAVLDVVTTDTAAVALYERLGWEFLATGQQEWGPDELVTVRCYAAPASGARSQKETP
ncbi:GNAT family N-acetyltransferase [Streptomyces sp. VRA16 Mangrove soil]|uniref:GNAT family N-acetyltransferase n=1 Tax=Streptomyces sp. VRA16 Mangrove soil TaxID=2817434 RepID=UPI001A9EA8F7|nr:GNAT family N-acetyltransferase [Streptomyces sp. VRA16 Mangrove soil]MBO1332899.1 GNAT family N-acetyltransferase [Streptomyces sp. VRA16 Mangrove soil]